MAIRHWMGGSALVHGFWPALEDAITLVQSVADGGARPDDSTETAIRATMVELDEIETKRKALRKRVMVDTAIAGGTHARIDPARGLAALRMEGRIVAGSLARYLGFKAVLTDIFSAAAPHIPPVIGPDLYSS